MSSFEDSIPAGRTAGVSPASLPVLGNDMNQCMMCKHLTKMGIHFNRGGEGWRCTAFPETDIPNAIVMGFQDHRAPWTGIVDNHPDNGILFEQADGWPQTYEELAGPLEDVVEQDLNDDLEEEEED